MQVNRNRCQMQHTTGVQVGEQMFKEVNNFKYLETNFSSTNDNYKEIKKHIASGNKSFYAFSVLMGVKATVEKIKKTVLQSTSQTSDNVCMRDMAFDPRR